MAKVFLAGATGAIGKRLVPQLLDSDYEVFGTTRSERKAAELKTAGVTPIVVDVFDAPALSRAMTAVRPEVVINQLTDLPANLEPSGEDRRSRPARRLRPARDARLRTGNLDPIVGVLTAVILLGETLGLWQVVGGVVALAGMWLASFERDALRRSLLATIMPFAAVASMIPMVGSQ